MASASRVRRALPFLLILGTLLFAAAFASSTSREEEGDRRKPSLRQCVRRCEDRASSRSRARCLEQCRDKQQERGRGDQWRGEEESEEEEEQSEFSRRRPYVFGRRSFRGAARSEHGSIRTLRPFHEASELLRGIRDYRVAVLEANPRSFVVPAHTDADTVGYVVQGEGVVATIEGGERRAYAVREGHVFVASAGAVTYFANTDGRRKLVIAKLLRTISVPGRFQLFFGPGGRNPESVLSGFSESVRSAAFKTSSDRLRQVFGKQDKGVIVRASEQQIRELRRHASESGAGQHWPLPPFGESSRGPFNLKDQRPSVANRHGQLFEADARSFRDLADLDVRVSLVNITAGSMTAPFYNTRSIKIAFVVNGEGHAEIVCPHLAGKQTQHEGRRGSEQQEEEESEESETFRRRREGSGSGSESESESEGEEEQQQAGQGYETVRARLSRGTVFVVPVGHPVVEVASRDGNLQIVCFEVQARRNERVYLAGQDSVFKKLDGAAKELAFQATQSEVDDVLRAQQDKGFLQGPQDDRREREHHQHGRRDDVAETLLRMATGRL